MEGGKRRESPPLLPSHSCEEVMVIEGKPSTVSLLLRDARTFFPTIWLFVAPTVLSPLAIWGGDVRWLLIHVVSYQSISAGRSLCLRHLSNVMLLGGRGCSSTSHCSSSTCRPSSSIRPLCEDCSCQLFECRFELLYFIISLALCRSCDALWSTNYPCPSFDSPFDSHNSSLFFVSHWIIHKRPSLHSAFSLALISQKYSQKIRKAFQARNTLRS